MMAFVLAQIELNSSQECPLKTKSKKLQKISVKKDLRHLIWSNIFAHALFEGK